MKRRQWTAAVALAFVVLNGCGGSLSKSATKPTSPALSTVPADLPAPSVADGRFLETAVSGTIQDCGEIGLAQITGVGHASERIEQADQARTSLATHVGELITLYRRVNPEALIPYGEGRRVTTREDILGILKNLDEKPAGQPTAEACAPELAKQLEKSTGLHEEG
jgi:hypothetical protein